MMARNEKSFAVGNSRALRLTPEISKLFINTISLTGRVTIAADRCCIGLTTAKDWLRKGREPGADEIFRDFANGVAQARSEFLLLASSRLNQLAVGGLITLPAYDKSGSPIRRHEADCAATGLCQCELVMVEKVLLPNPQVLMWTMDRVDPQPRVPEPEAPSSSAPALTDAEQVAQAAQHYDLWRSAIGIMLELGVPMPQLGLSAAAVIEVSGVKVESEPATMEANASPIEPAKESDSGEVNVSSPLKPEPAEPDAKPKPKFEDAF